MKNVLKDIRFADVTEVKKINTQKTKNNPNRKKPMTTTAKHEKASKSTCSELGSGGKGVLTGALHPRESPAKVTDVHTRATFYG